MTNGNSDFQHLDRAGQFAARLSMASTTLVLGTVSVLVFASWLLLLSMSAQLSQLQAGPGSEYLSWFPHIEFPAFVDSLIALCLKPAAYSGADISTFLAIASMWFLMSMAMMLPSSAPLIRTYCEIADTARASKKTVAHPFWLIAGYLSVWLVAAIMFAAINVLVGGLTGSEAGISPLSAGLSAVALGLAGLYQFSTLKESCLVKCRNPFATLFANWSDKQTDIFRLGIKQGVWCLGCCWALMLVMLAAGVMNVFWMALLAVFTVLEKTSRGSVLSHVAGAILLVWALALLLISG